MHVFIIYLCVCTHVLCTPEGSEDNWQVLVFSFYNVGFRDWTQLSIWEKVALPTAGPSLFVLFFERRSLLEPDTCWLLPLPSGGNGVTGYMPNYMRTCLPNFFQHCRSITFRQCDTMYHFQWEHNFLSQGFFLFLSRITSSMGTWKTFWLIISLAASWDCIKSQRIGNIWNS